MFRIRLEGIGQLNFLVITGHLLAILALVGLFITPSVLQAVVITLALGLVYLALSWRTGESVHLYPSTLFFTAAYLISVGQIGWRDAMLFWALPLQLVFFGLAFLIRRKSTPAFAIPFEVAGIIAGFFLAGQLFWLSPLLIQPILVVLGLAFLALINLGLAWVHNERWFIFSSALFLALTFLFILRFAPGGVPESLIIYFSATSLLYGLIGYWIRQSRGESLAEPVEAAAVVVGLVGGIAGLIQATTVGLNALLVGAIAYGVLFATSRSSVYAYLIFLSAGAMGFQFVRISGERFSAEFVDQFLVGLAIVSIVFAYPLIRSLRRREGSIQEWLIEGSWPRVTLVGLPLVIMVVTIGANYVFEASANPTFCGSCHVMESQYDAWTRSLHSDISCDTCHYPPGVEFFIQGKIVGLTEVVNNMAGTYGTRHHGTVDNANCESCHAINELIGVSSPYRGDIYFNHTELEPDKNSNITMRCNNCHAHIVDGFHFQVRESTCYWCHFMGQTGQSTAVGTCFSCHEVPRDYTHMGVIPSNNERDCTGSECHVSVTVGDGEVRSERCLSCHGQIDPRAGDALVMHDLHIVAETTFLSRKLECIECHDEITHGEEEFDMGFVPLFGP
jgi:nitrate/TMAO reductase-like tetraheme cytochrome c subunit